MDNEVAVREALDKKTPYPLEDKVLDGCVSANDIHIFHWRMRSMASRVASCEAKAVRRK